MLSQIQKEIGEWSLRNFGDQISKQSGQRLGSLAPLLGVMEEVGELVHCVLKRHQGIRGYEDTRKYEAERDDAIADAMVYLLDFCEREGVNAEAVLERTWSKVKQRDWQKNKENAHEVADQSVGPLSASG